MSVEENVLARPVTMLFGVGPERAKQLERLDIRTVEDVLLLRPNRHEDRRKFAPIAELQLKESTLTCGKVVAAGLKIWKRGANSVFTVVLDDGTARLHCQWFMTHRFDPRTGKMKSYLEDYFAKDQEVV